MFQPGSEQSRDFKDKFPILPPSELWFILLIHTVSGNVNFIWFRSNRLEDGDQECTQYTPNTMDIQSTGPD